MQGRHLRREVEISMQKADPSSHQENSRKPEMKEDRLKNMEFSEDEIDVLVYLCCALDRECHDLREERAFPEEFSINLLEG